MHRAQCEEPNPFPNGKGNRIKKMTGATSPDEGRGKSYSALTINQIKLTTTRIPSIAAVMIAPVARFDAALK